MKINLKRYGIKDMRRGIFADLVAQFTEEFDLDPYRAGEYIKSKEGQDVFIKWLTDQGYKLKKYSWPTDKEPVSSGLEFDDDDPLIIALKLKHNESDNKSK